MRKALALALGAGSASRTMAQKVQGIFGGSLTGGMYLDADYGIVPSGSDVIAWTSWLGGITAHRPAYYGKTGNAPTFNAAGMGSRATVDLVAASTQALILDGLASVYTGVNSTKTWTTVAHMTHHMAANAYLISAGNSAAANPYTAHGIAADYDFRQVDDAAAAGHVTGPNVSKDVEHVVVWSKNGTAYSFWIDAVPFAGNPVAGAAIGQSTIDHVAIGAMYRNVDTWTSYITTHLRRLVVIPDTITASQVAATQQIWYGT